MNLIGVLIEEKIYFFLNYFLVYEGLIVDF